MIKQAVWQMKFYQGTNHRKHHKGNLIWRGTAIRNNRITILGNHATKYSSFQILDNKFINKQAQTVNKDLGNKKIHLFFLKPRLYVL
jgi:hypothetical protein